MKPQYINRTLTPPEPMAEKEDNTEEVLAWVKRHFQPDEIFHNEQLVQWAHSNNYLTIEEYLEWQRFNQHMTLEDYCKSLKK